MSLLRMLPGRVVVYDPAQPESGISNEYGHLLSIEEARAVAAAAAAHLSAYTSAEIEEYNRAADAEDARLNLEPPPRLKKVARAGFVYLMVNRRNGMSKIGFSRSPKFRESTLQSEEPEVEILGAKAGTLDDEKALHAKFSTKRVRGEWFLLSPEEQQAVLSN